MPTDKEFEDFFREQLNGLEEAPPLNAWQGIREEIAVKPRRLNTSWYAVPALFFLIGIATFLGLRKPAAEKKTAQRTTETSPVFQPENSGQPEQKATTPYEAGKQEKNGTPAKEELVIPGTERNSVYRTYLAVQKNAVKAKTPVLEASAKRSKPMAEVATAAQAEENAANYAAAQKQEALKIAEETSMNLATATTTESVAEKTVISQHATAKKQKDVTEAITETFGAQQTYTEAIADTVNSMVLEVQYSVQPEQKKSWFGRITKNLRSLFSSGK